MESVLVNVKKKSDAAFLVSLAKKLGMSAKPLTKSEIEDWKFAQKIEAGMKTTSVSRAEIMKALGK
jgi:2-iminoacetate synthase ThiH